MCWAGLRLNILTYSLDLGRCPSLGVSPPYQHSGLSPQFTRHGTFSLLPSDTNSTRMIQLLVVSGHGTSVRWPHFYPTFSRAFVHGGVASSGAPLVRPRLRALLHSSLLRPSRYLPVSVWGVLRTTSPSKRLSKERLVLCVGFGTGRRGGRHVRRLNID